MKQIIDFLDKEGMIDDDAVAYNYHGPYPFTLQEFREFTEKIWNDAGGWDASENYYVEGTTFETYHVPFPYDGKQYYLSIMYGQGSAWTVFTEFEFGEYKKRLEEVEKVPLEDDEMEVVPSEAGGATMEERITTSKRLEEVLKEISFVNTVLDFKWKFEYMPVVVYDEEHTPRDGWLVWVSFERPDTITGVIGRGRGRDELIWESTTLSGVVKTCWLLVELMVRHELMEGFRWDNARIFNPHNTVGALASLQKKHNEENGIK